jgi:hypothetical protein
MTDDTPSSPVITIGRYLIGDHDEQRFYIADILTGEAGTFNKEEFEAYIAAFFGLNY